VGDAALELKPTQNSTVDRDSAFKQVAMPAPTPRAQAAEASVDPRNVVADQLVSPHGSAGLDAASPETVMKAIEAAVADIYAGFENVLGPTKEILKHTPNPPRTPLAIEIVKIFVEIAANATIGETALRTAKRVKATLGEVAGGAIGNALQATAKKEGEAAGAWAEKAMKPQEGGEPKARGHVALAGGSLLEDFLQREGQVLKTKKREANTTLLRMHEVIAQIEPHKLKALSDAVEAVAADSDINAWFQHRVAMEWLNFCARISLGERPAEQRTEMRGANEIDGVSKQPGGGFGAWKGGVGFVDIRVDAPKVITGLFGLSLKSARVTGSVGAAEILRSAGQDLAADGQPYSLANLPVYRRVWFVNGTETKFDRPELVITPDGRIEVDTNSPTLRAIATGQPTELDTLHLYPTGQVHGQEAAVGGQLIAGWLGVYGTDVLQ
jgi:hypothetical protein